MSETKITLINSNQSEIYQDGKTIYKELTGNNIITSSEDNLILATVSALLGNICAEMNEVAIQNYLRYSSGKRLDLKGELYGDVGARLKANAGRTTIECKISEVIDRDIIIRQGTRFIHNNYIFKTVEEGKIINGKLTTEVIAECVTKGDIGEILAGEITEIVDKYDYYESIKNITKVTGGVDEESDEAYKERIKNIPESFSTAGPQGAYKSLTYSASPLVFDVVIESPIPNKIDIYVTDIQKLIPNEEKQKIKEFLDDEFKRPLNDLVTIKDPKLVNYNLEITYYLYPNFPQSKIEIETNLLMQLKKLTNSMKIGEEINEQDIIAIAKELGIKKILIQTTEFPEAVEKTELLICKSINLMFGGSD